MVQNLRQNSQRRVGLERGVRAAVLDQQAANGQVIDSSGRWSSAKSSHMLSERSRAYSRPFLNVFSLFWNEMDGKKTEHLINLFSPMTLGWI